jgi:hypothetical protein
VKAAIISLLAALAGASVAAVAESTRDWLVAAVGAAVALEVVALRSRIEQSTDVGVLRVWRRVELLAIPVVVAALQLASGTGIVLGVEFAVGVVVGGVVWALVNATLVDLDAIDRAIDDTDGMSPLQRIRLRMVATGVASVFGAAVGAVGIDGVLDLARPAATTWSLAPFGFFVVGLAALGMVARFSESRRWRRDGVSVDAVVEPRWANVVAVTVAAVGAVALVLGYVRTGLSALPVRGLLETGRFGSWLGDRTARMREALGGTETVQDSLPAGSPPTSPGAIAGDPVAPWLGDVALWVFIALIFGFAVVAGRRRRERPDRGESVGFRDVIRQVVEAIAELVAGVWAGLRRLLQRRRQISEADAEVGVPLVAAGRVRWNPHDPVRRRVAVAYRQAVDIVSVWERPPGRPETPREFAHHVDDGRFHRVTALFEEARYSDHVLPTESATTAESVARELDS